MMEINDLNTFFRLDLFDRLVFKFLTKQQNNFKAYNRKSPFRYSPVIYIPK